MNKSLATRFKKFLIENGASVHVDNQTSTYYKYCDKKIRVSDHLPAIFGCNIYVILPVDSNQFIVAINGHLTIFENYSKVTEFFKNYFLLNLCNEECTKSVEKKIKNKYSKAFCLEKERMANDQKNNLKKAKNELIKSFENNLKGITLEDGKFLKFNAFTEKQKKQIINFIDSNKALIESEKLIDAESIEVEN